MARRGRLALTAALAMLAPATAAAAIDIKGVRLGMTAEELTQRGAYQYGHLPSLMQIDRFTVGGVNGRFNHLALFLQDGKLAEASFMFDSSDFADVLAAVKAKYPSFKCATSKVQTRGGALLSQAECRLKDSTGVLSLTRYAGDARTSFLQLRSHEHMKAAAEADRKARGDF